MVTLFLGGPQPLTLGDVDIFGWAGPFGGTIWVIVKLLAFLYTYVWFRATLPRLRYDQLMDLGWKLLIPVALGWFLVLAALQMTPRQVRRARPGVAGGGDQCAVLSWGTCSSAPPSAWRRRNRDTEGAAY